MRRLTTLLLIVIPLLAVVFLLQNMQPVGMTFFFFDASLPIAALAIAMLLLGFVSGVLVRSRLDRNAPKK